MDLNVSDNILDSCSVVKEVLASDNEDDLNSIQQLISGFENTSIFNGRGRVSTDESLNNAMVEIDGGDIQISVREHRGFKYQLVFDVKSHMGFICVRKDTLSHAKTYNHFMWRISGVINSGRNIFGQTVLFGKTSEAEIENDPDEELARDFLGEFYDQLHQLCFLSYDVQEGIVNVKLQKYDGHKQLLGEVEISSNITQEDTPVEQLTIDTSDVPDASEEAETDVPIKLRPDKGNLGLNNEGQENSNNR